MEKEHRNNRNASVLRSLTFRLIGLVILTVLPLNVIVIGLSGLRLSAVLSEQRELRESELGLTMSSFSDGISYISDELDGFVRDYQNTLGSSSEEDVIVSYEMARALYRIFEKTGLQGNVSLQFHGKNFLYYLYTPGVYDAAEAEAIRTAIITSDIVTTRGWVIRVIAGRPCYMRNYLFNQYTLSLRIDLTSFCKQKVFPDLSEEAVYFSDGREYVRLYPDGSMQKLLLSEVQFQKDRDWIVWEDKELGCGLWMKAAPEGPGIQNYYRLGLFILVLFVILFSAALAPFLYYMVLQPIQKLQNAMAEIEKGRTDFRIEEQRKTESNEFTFLFDSFNRMADEVEASHEKDMQMIRAELDNLRLQVNPHMLLNSFNTIYSLAQTKKTDVIQDFSLYLVDYFRYVLRETSDFVPLEREMAFVESYTGIQKIRFPGAFTSVFQVTEEAKNALVPPLLVENFVENSMKYALVPGKVIEVLIHARVQDERLLISVSDTGRGIREDVLETIRSGEPVIDKTGKSHIGIWNCRRRMEVFYGAEAVMNIISSEGAGTQIFLDLPLRLSQEETA